jgi:hypothetical protein
LTGSVPIESIAQAIHERWRREAIANDDTAPTWQQPGESRKESSRDQARRMPTHLHKVGCAIAPLQDRTRSSAPAMNISMATNGEGVEVFSLDWRNRAKPLRPSGPHSRRRRLGDTGADSEEWPVPAQEFAERYTELAPAADATPGP